MKLSIAFIISIAAFCTSQNAFAQYSVSGTVSDVFTGEPVEGVLVRSSLSGAETATSASGFFSLSIPAGTADTITFSRIGYRQEAIFVPENSKGKRNLQIRMSQYEILSGDIEVNEGRIMTELRYATLPVSVVTESEIKGLPFIAVPNAIQNETGISLLRDGVWANEVSIRGLSRDNVVTLVNGNRIETANNHAGRLALIDLNTVERIELVKGGTSSIYGSGAMGGIVNIVTKEGSFSRNTRLSGSMGGMYAQVNQLASANLSVQFTSPFLYFNSYLLTRNSTDMNTPSGIIPNSSFRDGGVHLDAGVKLSVKSRVKGTFEYFNSPYAGIPGGDPVFPEMSRTTYLNAKRIMSDLTFESAGISKSFTKFSARLFFQSIDRDVEVLPNTVTTLPPSGSTPARKIYNLSIYPSGYHDAGGALIQSEFLLSPASRLVAGVDTWMRKLKTERERTQRTEFLDSGGNVTSASTVTTADVPVPESQYLSSGIFVQNQTSLMNERFYLDLSGRIDGIFISNEQSISPLYTITNGVKNTSPPGQKVIWPEQSENDVSWSAGAGANYKISQPLNAYANFSASYRSPGLEERYQYIDLGSIVRLGNPDLKPERGYFISSGIKYWGDDLNLSIEGFTNFLKDLVVEMPGTYEGRQALIKQNVGSSTIAGFDANAEYNFAGPLTFKGGVSFVTGEDNENQRPLPQIAPLNLRLGISCLLPAGLRMFFGSTIYDRQDRVADGESATPGYAVFDLYGSYSLPMGNSAGVMISAGIENMLDKNYRSHLTTARGTVTSEPGRNAFLNLTLNYR